MKKLILPLLLALASSLPLSAAPYNVWSQTNSYSGTPNFSHTFTFDQFNALPAGWTVTSVVFRITLNASDLAFAVSNISSSTTINWNDYTLGVGGASAQTRVVIVPTGTTNSLNAFGYVELPPVLIAPLAKYSVVGGPYATGITNTFTSEPQISAFVGSGTYDVQFRVATLNTANVVGGDAILSPTPGNAMGTVIADFFYSIPEPSTYAMIGGSVLMLLALKRRGKNA
jgi:hypothetical protein